MRGARAASMALALLLAACAETGTDPLLPPDADARAAAEARSPASAPLVLPTQPGVTAPPAATASTDADLATPPAARPPATAMVPGAASDAPHIYMALQRDTGRPVSVVLAIDGSRDNTPSDDPAIRITPEDGQCNPQQLGHYDFPPERAQRPAYGTKESAGGITARDLPDFMATAVTSEMLAAGLIDDPEESQPQNVCTRKLLQRLIIDLSTAGAS